MGELSLLQHLNMCVSNNQYFLMGAISNSLLELRAQQNVETLYVGYYVI